MSDLKTILPPNASQMERDIEIALARRVEGVPVPIRSLWRPQDCPASHLAWLAWALSVDVWNGAWAEEVRRQVVAGSIPLHRVKGTLGAVKRALAGVHSEADVIEWWQDASEAHTFKITVTPTADLMGETTGPIFSDALISELRRVVDAAKPVRSHYALRLRPLSRSTIRPACAATAKGYSRASVTARQPGLAMTPVLRPAAAAAAKTHGRAALAMKTPGITARVGASIGAGLVVRERLSIEFRSAA